jgi:hypothetical protein
MIALNYVTPKAAAKHDVLCNELSSDLGLLNKCSCLAALFGVTTFVTVLALNLVTLCCPALVRLRYSTNWPLKVRLHWRDFAGDFALSWHI